MRHRVLRSVLMVILALVLAAPAGAQEKPYTQEQVQALVRSGLGDETGAKLVIQQGIDFALTEDFLQSLTTAGAHKVFLEALRATRPQAGGGGVTRPLTQVQVLSLVAGAVPSQRVAMLVQQRGIDFDLTTEFFRELHLAGGDDALDDALESAKVSKFYRFDPASVTQPVRDVPAPPTQQVGIRPPGARAAELIRNRQNAEAEAEYRAAIQRDPQNANLHISLGIALGLKGDWDGQIAEDREAVRLSPTSDLAHLNLGLALSRQNDEDGAVEEYREAIRLNPNNDRAHTCLGIRLSRRGDWDGAIGEYTEAVRLNPNNYALHYSLGMAYEHQGNRQAALQEYHAASELNPRIPVYQQAYERLAAQGN